MLRLTISALVISLITACSSSMSVIGTTTEGLEWTGSIGFDELVMTDGNTICTGQSGRNLVRLDKIQFTCDDGRSGSLAFSMDTPIASGIQGVITFSDGSKGQLYLLGD